MLLNQDLAADHYGSEHVWSIVADQPIPVTSDPDSVQRAVAVTLAASVGANRNVASGGSPSPQSYQGEIQIVVNPNDPSQIVAAANTWDTMGGACGGGIQAVFYSSDGGNTWGYTCAPDDGDYPGMSCSGTVFGSDPALYWNDNDEVFLNYMLLCSTGGSTQYSMVVARSADGGATWAGQGIIKDSWGTGELEDKNFYIIDNHPGSPYSGRHYTCWDRGNDEKFAYSTNNGQTWTEVDLPAVGGLDLGCEMAVEDDGTVHIVYDTLTCGSQSCTNEEMFYSRSTDGGASWSSPVEVRDFSLVSFSTDSTPDAQDERGVNPFGALDVDNSGGPCDGYLYATFSDKTSSANDADVYVSRSTDGGASWETPVTVNDDGLADRIQFHPTMLVDQSNGDVFVAWHDARNDSGNDAVDYFVGRSTDCGLTWENVQASAPSSEFNNSSISYTNLNSSDNPNRNPNQYGEYMGLDVLNGTAYLAWTDSRHYFPGSTSESEAENLGFAIVDYGGNQSPAVSITAPADGSTFDLGASVSFTGTASDTEDGDLSSGLSWSSSIDGAIGSGAS
ncbi:MAG: sialidase family protein, partial [Halobacteriales archaeon]|nr:sialidase family protein [Halobacteriales archaeon]